MIGANDNSDNNISQGIYNSIVTQQYSIKKCHNRVNTLSLLLPVCCVKTANINSSCMNYFASSHILENMLKRCLWKAICMLAYIGLSLLGKYSLTQKHPTILLSL